MIALRPLQTSAIEALRAEVAQGRQRVVLVAPTGFGKTHVIVAVALGHLRVVPDARVLVLVHRRELVRQTAQRFAAAGLGEERVSIVQADTAGGTPGPVTVASIPTLYSRGIRPPATLVIWDECHHCPAASFRKIHADYPDALHIGVTATAERADGQPLGDMFESLVQAATMRQLVELGLLVRSDVLAPPQVTDAMWAHPLDAYRRYTPTGAAVVFATGIAHARRLAEEFTAAGYPAACVDGDMRDDDRDDALARFDAGEINVITNVFCLTEGWDSPRANTCILSRAPAHAGTYLQMVGRVLRPHPGKTLATVLDLRGAVNLHGLPDEDRRWSLDGKAVVRTEPLKALARCKACLAIFRPSNHCPRCGAEREVQARVTRTLNRAEKLERLSHLTQEQRDARYLKQLRWVASVRLRLEGAAAERWALGAFLRRFGREPELGNVANAG